MLNVFKLWTAISITFFAFQSLASDCGENTEDFERLERVIKQLPKARSSRVCNQILGTGPMGGNEGLDPEFGQPQAALSKTGSIEIDYLNQQRRFSSRGYWFHRTKGKNQKEDKNRPTIVHFVGGPGYAASQDGMLEGIPAEYDILMMDYPGLGHNTHIGKGLDKASAFSVSTAGRSAAKVIQSLGLTNYILHGHSYGTAVATAAAHFLSDSAHPPKSVILEAVLGRSYRVVNGLNENDKSIQSVSDSALKALRGREQKKFRRLVKKMIKKSAPEIVAGFLSEPLSSGKIITAEFLRSLLDYDAETLLGCIRQTFEQPMPMGESSPQLEPDSEYHMHAYCEISGDGSDRKLPLFQNLMQITGVIGQECKCSDSKIKGKYDSKDFQIRNTTLYYFNSSDDPATPLWQAQYHHKNQKTAKKKFLKTEVGHDSVTLTLEGTCQIDFWKAVFEGRTDIQLEEMTTCIESRDGSDWGRD